MLGDECMHGGLDRIKVIESGITSGIEEWIA